MIYQTIKQKDKWNYKIKKLKKPIVCDSVKGREEMLVAYAYVCPHIQHFLDL